jgi:hypothetical protein
MSSLVGTGRGPRTRTSKNYESAVFPSGGRNVVIPRRMKDPKYRQSQLGSVHEEHIAPVTDFISRLSAERPELAGVPFVAPHYRPETARLLSLSSNPGPRAGGEKGSGLLSVQNDASAERMLKVYAAAGLRDGDVVPWNAFPWFVHEQLPNGLTSDYIEQGVHVLSRFLDLCPNIVSIVAHGGDAHRCAQLLRSSRIVGPLVRRRGIHTWDARHTSNRAFMLSPQERRDAEEDMAETYRQAMAHAGLAPREP